MIRPYSKMKLLHFSLFFLAFLMHKEKKKNITLINAYA